MIVKIASTKKELKACYDIRAQVFVDEQGISRELELDEYDATATHVIAIDKKPVGTARYREVKGMIKVERMAILKSERGKGIGKKMFDFIKTKNKGMKIYVHAQWDAQGFYYKCGLVPKGEPFMEAGIKHIKYVSI